MDEIREMEGMLGNKFWEHTEDEIREGVRHHNLNKNPNEFGIGEEGFVRRWNNCCIKRLEILVLEEKKRKKREYQRDYRLRKKAENSG
jgi:hypothetical protein